MAEVDDTLKVTVFTVGTSITRLAEVPRRLGPLILNEVEGPGAGSFTVQASDPQLAKLPNLLDYRNVVKLTRGETVEGAFVVQSKKHTIISESEESKEAILVSGEGLKTWTKDADVYPWGGIQAGSAENRVFSWASPKGLWYKTADWKVPVRQWPYEMIPARGSDNPWPYRPAEWPDAPGAWWIWSVKENHPGDQYSTDNPQGYNYFRYEFDTTQEGKYSVFAAGDNTLRAFIDGNSIIESDDFGSYHQTFRADFDLQPGHHVLAFRVWNNEGPGALIASLWRAGDAAAGSAAQLLSVTGGSGWVVNGYPTTEPGWTIGEVILTLLAEAKARGVRFPNFLTPTFTGSKDSAGKDWDAALPWTFRVGSSYFEVLEMLEEFSADVWIDPKDFKLYAWNKRGTDRSFQDGTKAPVTLRAAWNLKSALETGQADIKNNLLMKTNDGWVEVAPGSLESLQKYGRIEGQLSTDASLAVSRRLAEKVFDQKALVEEGAEYVIHPRERAWPLRDFFEGDWVLAPNSKGELVKRRVMSISASESATTGEPTYSIEFDTIFKDSETQLAKLMSIAAGGGLGASFANGSAPSTSTGTPTKTPLGGPIQSRPGRPTGLTALSVGKWNEGGGPYSTVTLDWEAGVNSSNVLFYEVLARRTERPADELLTVGTVSGGRTSIQVSPLQPGVSWTFYVQASLGLGRLSELSDPVIHTTAMPNLIMDAPSKPTLETAYGTASVIWDGKTALGQQMPYQFAYVYALVADSENGTYTPIGATISAEGSIVATGLTVKKQYWFALKAVDRLGKESDRSQAAAITIEGIDTEALEGEIREELDQVKQDTATALNKADKAATDAAAANTAAGDAQDAADKAAQDALSAAGIANGKGKVIFQPSPPTGENASVNNLWINTTNGLNTPNRYDTATSSWVPATDKAATDAASLASAAKTTADKAATDAAAAAVAAGNAQTAANGKSTVWYQTTKPAGTAHKVNDTWFDTDDGNKIYRWDGSDWTSAPLGTSSIGPGAVAAGNIAQAVNDKIAQGITDSAAAQATANSKSKNWPTSTTAPTTGMAANDTWIRSTDGTLFRYSGSAWVAVPLATQSYVQSRGLNLVTNGSGLLNNNTNFEAFIFDGSDHPVGAAGMFTTSLYTSGFATELIPVDPALTYEMSAAVKQLTGQGNFYFAVAPYDADSSAIVPQMYTSLAGSITTLAQPLNPGDTTITLTSANGWHTGSMVSMKYAAVGGHKDGKGYTWPAGTYTRVFPAFSSISGNVVTLTAPYTGRAAPAGTDVWNSFAAGTYLYPVSNAVAPKEWGNFSGRFAGVTPAGPASSTTLPRATSFVKVGFLANYPPQTTPYKQGFANIALNEITVAANAQGAATAAQSTATAAQGAAATAQTAATAAKTAADAADARALAAAGVADSKGKVIFQATAPTGANAVAANLWIDTTGGKNTPNRYDTASSTWVPVTDKAATDAATAAAAAQSTASNAATAAATAKSAADQAKAAADAAQAKADQASADAAVAQSTANGKNTVTYGTAAPTIQGLRAGDIFFVRVAATGVITAQYEWTGTAWQQRTLDNAVIANLDAGKLTAGTISADRIGTKSLTASEVLVDGSITALQIATNTLTAAQIKAGTITSTEIATGTITAESGIIASLDAGTITTGFLSSARIQALSISADKILVGSSSSVFTGGDFEGTIPFTGATTGRASIDTTFSHTGTRSLHLVQGSAAQTITGSGTFPVAEGDKITFGYWGFIAAAYSSDTTNRFELRDQNGVLIRDFTFGGGLLTPGQWTQVGPEYPFTIPAGVTSLRLSINVAAGAAVGTVWLDDITLVVSKRGALVVDGSIMVDGTISGTKLVSNSVTADQIKANSITAVQIAAGTIEANNIKSGTITTLQLAANSITTSNLAADAITAKHTITGALIRTAATGARTEVNSSGVRVIGADGTDKVRLGYGIDTGMSVQQPGTTNMIPLAPLVLGMKAWQENFGPAVTTRGPGQGWGDWINPKDANQGVFETSSPTGRFLILTSMTAPVNSQQNYSVNMQAGFYFPKSAMSNDISAGLETQQAFSACYANGEFPVAGMEIITLVANRVYNVRPIFRGSSNYDGGNIARATSMRIIVIPL